MRFVPALVLSLMLLAGPAWADCARPPYYGVHLTDTGGVRVCVDEGGRCPGPLLRQQVDSGVVVELSAAFCADAGCYQDECVPPGTYRYGLKTPLTCSGCGHDAPYWEEVTITQAPAAGCTWTAGNPWPSGASGVPWPASDEPSICHQCGCSSTQAVLGFNGLLAGVALLWLSLRRRA